MKKIIIGLVCLSLLVVGCGKNTDKDKNTDKTTSASDAKVEIQKDSGLEVSSDLTKDNKIVFTVKNTAKETFDNVLFNIAYYDKDNKLIATTNSYTRNLQAGKQSYVVVDFPRDYVKYETQIPAKVEVMVNKEIYETKTVDIHTSKVTATTKKADDTLLNVNVKNASGVALNDVELVTIFYKDNKIVGAAASYLTQVRGTGTTTVSAPFTTEKNGNGKTIDYDKVETFVNSASKTKAS